MVYLSICILLMQRKCNVFASIEFNISKVIRLVMNKARLEKLNGHYYLLFETGRIDRLDGIDDEDGGSGLSIEELKIAIEYFSAGKANIKIIN